MHHEPIKPIELTPQQKSKWNDTMSMFVFSCPGFRHLFYTLLSNNEGGDIALFTKKVPMAATDAKNIMINPEEFFLLPPKQRVFVLAHEIVHNVYDDPAATRRVSKSGELRYADGVVLPFDNKLWQTSLDLRINAALIDSNIGEMPTGKWEGRYDETGKIAKADDGVYDIYRRRYEQQQKDKKTGGGSQGPGGFDECMEPGASTGQDPNVAAAERSVQKWATEMAVAQSLEAMKSQGKISANLQRMFDIYLKRQVPWTDHIQGLFARKLGSGGSDWRRPDRRFITRDIYIPSRSGHGVNWVCVWGDTSGSIGAAELNTYFAELAGLVEELNPKRVTVFWCDAKIKHVDDLTDVSDLQAIKARGVGGGGGTSCRPVFAAIDKMEMEPPDAFVGLTDGHANFPDKVPSYPCVWACTTGVEIPFGEIVRINTVTE